jgi:hypothetical protein
MTGILQAILAGYGGAGATFTVIQTFTASGTWTCPTGVTEVEYLVVAGGGGGSDGGGGGAGGFRTGTGLAVTGGTTYTITVGAGGAGGPNNGTGTQGLDSSIAGSPITESPSGAGTNTLKAYGGGLVEGAVELRLLPHLLNQVALEILRVHLRRKETMAVVAVPQTLLVVVAAEQVQLAQLPQQMAATEETELRQLYLVRL